METIINFNIKKVFVAFKFIPSSSKMHELYYSTTNAIKCWNTTNIIKIYTNITPKTIEL